MMRSLSKKVGTRSCHRSCFYTMMILLIHLERLSLLHSMKLNGRSYQTPTTRRFHMSLDISRSWVPKARCMFVQPVEHTTNMEEVTLTRLSTTHFPMRLQAVALHQSLPLLRSPSNLQISFLHSPFSAVTSTLFFHLPIKVIRQQVFWLRTPKGMALICIGLHQMATRPLIPTAIRTMKLISSNGS